MDVRDPSCFDNSSSNVNVSLWKCIWKAQVMPKVKNFIWRLVIGAIPTNANLQKRGMKLSSCCSICNGESETSEHIFLRCPWVKAVWFGLLFQWSMERMNLTDFKSWFLERIDRISESGGDNCEPLIAMFFNILWGIWTGRNKFIFENLMVNPTYTIQSSKDACLEFINANMSNRVLSSDSPSTTLRVPRDVWTPPPLTQ